MIIYLLIFLFFCSLTKEERRRLFAIRVAAQDEALRLKRNQEALVGGDIWRRHLEHCLSLGFDPSVRVICYRARFDKINS